MMGHGGNNAQFNGMAVSILEFIHPGNPGIACLPALKFAQKANSLDKRVGRYSDAAIILGKGHSFNKTQHQVPVTAVIKKGCKLLKGLLKKNGIYFYGKIFFIKGPVYCRQDVLQSLSAGNEFVAIPVKGIDTDIKLPHLKPGKIIKVSLQMRSIRGKAEFNIREQLPDLPDDINDSPADKGLTAGKPDLANSHGHKDPDEMHKFLVPQNHIMGKPFNTVRRHAVSATQIAFISNRHPKVVVMS